jgi:hypothetical protein
MFTGIKNTFLQKLAKKLFIVSIFEVTPGLKPKKSRKLASMNHLLLLGAYIVYAQNACNRNAGFTGADHVQGNIARLKPTSIVPPNAPFTLSAFQSHIFKRAWRFSSYPYLLAVRDVKWIAGAVNEHQFPQRPVLSLEASNSLFHERPARRAGGY